MTTESSLTRKGLYSQAQSYQKDTLPCLIKYHTVSMFQSHICQKDIRLMKTNISI